MISGSDLMGRNILISAISIEMVARSHMWKGACTPKRLSPAIDYRFVEVFIAKDSINKSVASSMNDRGL